MDSSLTVDSAVGADSEEVVNAFTKFFQAPNLWLRVLYVVLLLAVCLIVMKLLMSVLNRALDRLNIEKGLHTFIKSVVKILLWFVTIIIVLGYVGIEVTSLIALLSVIGLAISLAIQGTLSNLAGGIQVLVSKPFKAGDYIETDSVSGTVSEIGLVYTKIKTYDNKMIMIPNGQISSAKITNYTAEERRRVDLKFNTSYDAPVELVKETIQSVIRSHPKALRDPAPFARVSAYQDSSIEYAVRVWCATEDYWTLYSDLLEQVKAAFDQNGIEMTYNHLNVHMIRE
ncbi:mechanosensitive ion channel family protein [Pseudoflavonifractor intestinihominis]|uniref:Mechanosensitive ion channel family protein n=1 Tax=Pseudoflavonifractor intestinihominis TaxID=3133171 RepID=A0ABV1EB19_9FIRM|nr:mechanosensitive ion channel family protein [uncultured Pseudoflavonifractor sp.]